MLKPGPVPPCLDPVDLCQVFQTLVPRAGQVSEERREESVTCSTPCTAGVLAEASWQDPGLGERQGELLCVEND